jgi:hypothetical protein
MLKKKKILFALLSLIIIGVLVFGIILFPVVDEKYFHIFRNDEATCIGCFSNIGLSLQMYAIENNEYFPAGKKTPLESLNIIFENGEQDGFAANMASHNQRSEFLKYYQKYKKIPEHLSCYKYNEGLTNSAPHDSVLMYYYKPIKWASRDRPTRQKGRAVLAIDGSVQFYSEEEFQKKQKATLEWITKNKVKSGTR